MIGEHPRTGSQTPHVPTPCCGEQATSLETGLQSIPSPWNYPEKIQNKTRSLREEEPDDLGQDPFCSGFWFPLPYGEGSSHSVVGISAGEFSRGRSGRVFLDAGMWLRMSEGLWRC